MKKGCIAPISSPSKRESRAGMDKRSSTRGSNRLKGSTSVPGYHNRCPIREECQTPQNGVQRKREEGRRWYKRYIQGTCCPSTMGHAVSQRSRRGHWVSPAYPPHTPNRRLFLVNLEKDMQISQAQHVHRGEPFTVKFSYFSCLLIATAVEIPPILRFSALEGASARGSAHEVLSRLEYICDRLTQRQR